MSIDEVKQTADEKMHKSIELLRTNLSKIRTGRPSPAILDHVHVDYYGSMVPISQVANVTLVDARTLGVSPWEKKMAQVIDKAIRESDLGLNPSMVGELIRVPMPPLSEERRKELAKVVKGEGEHAKVAVRNLRRDANEQLKRMIKDKSISEDDERRAQDEIQKLTDRCIVEIDKVLAAKEQEIMTV
ncbi:MAG: ribosome recycling factor [Gammaproteobacteria bacterium]|jgi:ribosome recycling factor